MSKKLLLRWVFWKYRSSEKGGSECLPPGLFRPKEMTLWNSSQVNLLERTEHYASPWADLKKDSDDSKGIDETTEVTMEANKVPDSTKKRMAEEIQPTFPSTSTSTFKAKLVVGPGLLRRRQVFLLLLCSNSAVAIMKMWWILTNISWKAKQKIIRIKLI